VNAAQTEKDIFEGGAAGKFDKNTMHVAKLCEDLDEDSLKYTDSNITVPI
jgi:hypothetical protein